MKGKVKYFLEDHNEVIIKEAAKICSYAMIFSFGYFAGREIYKWKTNAGLMGLICVKPELKSMIEEASKEARKRF